MSDKTLTWETPNDFVMFWQSWKYVLKKVSKCEFSLSKISHLLKKKVLKYQKHHSTGMSSFMIKVLKINDTLGEINNRNYRNL